MLQGWHRDMAVCKMRYAEAAEIVAAGQLEKLKRCPEEEAVYKKYIANLKLEWVTIGMLCCQSVPVCAYAMGLSQVILSFTTSLVLLCKLTKTERKSLLRKQRTN